MASGKKICIRNDWSNSVRDRLGIKKEQMDNLWGFVFFSPSLLFLLFLAGIPVVYATWISLTNATLFNIDAEFIGLENYFRLYSQPKFWESIWRGVLFTVGSITFQLVAAMALALVLNKRFFGSSVARALAIFPYLVPTIAVALMWKWMLSEAYGLVNSYALEYGLIENNMSFFGNIDIAMEVLIIANSWKFTSFAVLILLARLQSIDDAMYQQAKISGASTYQMFRDITLPSLRSAILLVVLLRGIWMFNKFDIIWLLTGGGPVEATTTLPVFIYRTSFFARDLALGSAAAINLFMILLVAASFYFWYFKPSQEIETTR